LSAFFLSVIERRSAIMLLCLSYFIAMCTGQSRILFCSCSLYEHKKRTFQENSNKMSFS